MGQMMPSPHPGACRSPQELGPNMASCKRRLSCPQTVQHLWDAIDSIRQQKQVSNLDRVANYMRRKHQLSEADTERQLGFAVRDGLVVSKKKVGSKGSKVGVEQEAFQLPNEPAERDGHDWYCFECHRGGEVLLCSTCHRVYHVVCVKEDLSNEDKFVCTVCCQLKEREQLKLKVDDMNLLLSYTCLRLKDKIAPQSPHLPRQAQTKDLHRLLLSEGDAWKQGYLIYQKMDLITMEEKTRNSEYTSLEEFHADAQTIVHNVVIFYGIHSCMADMARQMLRDCSYDLNEIRQCSACYRMSNEKRDKYWFCQPCDPPHDLVFAKQKGFPYWPAKVIRADDQGYDVRFFGGYHQRALVEKGSIKPITTSLKVIAAKRTPALNKALDELRRHQQLLEQQRRGGSGRPSEGTTATGVPRKRGRPPRVVQPSLPPPPATTRSASGDEEEEDDNNEEEQEESEESSEEETPSSSLPTKRLRLKEESSSEDHNVVSSSCQESPSSRVSTSTQTHRKMLAGVNKAPSLEEAPAKCDCDTKYRQAFREHREKLEAKYREEKEHLVQQIREEVQKQCEAEKLKEVSAVLERMRTDLEQHKVRDKEAREQEIAKLQERHRQEISETKKKQWCYNCEAEAIYHCCWNTLYCSVECQQVHWHKEHKRSCRRKQ
nr:zinc finger MYND domain-containing protein 11-like isoform X1 [Rhipicephalus microplus]